MPQLMPLFWVMSTFVLFMILLSMTMIYGDNYKMVYFFFSPLGGDSFIWCW